MKNPCFGIRFFSSRSAGTMSVTCRSELRCSFVGFTPVFNPLRSFNKIPGASVAIVNSDVDVGYRIFEKVFFYFLLTVMNMMIKKGMKNDEETWYSWFLLQSDLFFSFLFFRET